MKRIIEDSNAIEELNLKNNNRLDYILNCIEAGAWELDLATNVVSRTLQHDKIFGYSKLLKEWTFDIFLDHVVPEDKKKVYEKFNESIATKTDWDFECRIIRKDGCERWIFAKGSIVEFENKKPLRMLGIVQDITDRKQIEKEFIETENKYRKAQAMGHVGNWEFNVETSTFWASEEAKKIYGFNPNSPEFTTEEVEKCIPERERVHQALIDLIEKNQKYDIQFIIISKDKGEEKTIHSIAELERKADGRASKVSGVITDITQIKKRTEDLKKSERKFVGIFEQSPIAIEIYDKKGKLIDVNQQTLEMFGINDKKVVLGFDLWDDPNFSSESMIELKKGNPIFLSTRFNFDVVKKKNLYPTSKSGFIYMDMFAIPMMEKNKISGYIVQIVETTERKKAEESLIKLKTVIEKSEVTILITTEEGIIEYANPYFSKLTGYSIAEIIGKNPRLLKSEFHPKIFYEEMWNTIKSGQTWEGEFCNRKKNGDLFWEKAIITPIQNENKVTTNYVAIKTDISDDKKMEEQLRQSQKLESVGRLAGGVAHDFNNMLGVILGHTGMLLEVVGPDQPIYADLEEIRKAGERSADLTRQLLAFARKQTVTPKILDLNQAVGGMLNMLRRLIGEDINMHWLPGNEEMLINIDPSQIDQILANLCVNARDAINDIGKITIETDNATFDEAYCSAHVGSVPGEFVLLLVSDDGCGMDQETLSYIFEPFFTTKKQGKGTGLGLATIYGIVKQNNGFINVYSEPGLGTTFRIYLPRCNGKTSQILMKNEHIPDVNGHETILLVEDEDMILKMTTMMLERLGYTVMATSSPDEAIRLVKEHNGPIHLLMTDVVMPEMNGRDLARNILALYPNISRLFMSGYTADVIAHHGVLDKGVHFIQKPFSIKDLGAKVREALDNIL